MIAARSFQSLLHTLNFHLRDDFAIPHVAVRLWHRPEGSDELPEFADVSQRPAGFCRNAGAALLRHDQRLRDLVVVRRSGDCTCARKR
jgi:uncharacterized protein YigA (DUF484 family)